MSHRSCVHCLQEGTKGTLFLEWATMVMQLALAVFAFFPEVCYLMPCRCNSTAHVACRVCVLVSRMSREEVCHSSQGDVPSLDGPFEEHAGTTNDYCWCCYVVALSHRCWGTVQQWQERWRLC